VKIKPDPQKSLHDRREKELHLIFRKIPQKSFMHGLEVGAGDGFQSVILSRYVKNLVCTEFVPGRLPEKNSATIKYQVADAEKIDHYFESNHFNIVFSSNLMEHLNNPSAFLKGVKSILRNDGVSIHSMPNRFWKVCQMAFHHLNYLILLIERLNVQTISTIGGLSKHKKGSYDNPKQTRKNSFLRRVLWPIPHGVSTSNWMEFYLFGKKRWIKKFNENGFKVTKIIKGPISSGYSFGFTTLGSFLEKMGFCSEFIYITVKDDHNPKGKARP
jgi:SAM-dependent methyltransferase